MFNFQSASRSPGRFLGIERLVHHVFRAVRSISLPSKAMPTGIRRASCRVPTVWSVPVSESNRTSAAILFLCISVYHSAMFLTPVLSISWDSKKCNCTGDSTCVILNLLLGQIL